MLEVNNAQNIHLTLANTMSRVVILSFVSREYDNVITLIKTITLATSIRYEPESVPVLSSVNLEELWENPHSPFLFNDALTKRNF